MEEQTPAVRTLGRSHVAADGVHFDVAKLSVEYHPDRSATLTYWLTVRRQDHPVERWVFTLPWDDKSFMDVITSPAPDPERLRQLVDLVHSLLEEWWDTKGYNRRSAKMGRQLS